MQGWMARVMALLKSVRWMIGKMRFSRLFLEILSWSGPVLSKKNGRNPPNKCQKQMDDGAPSFPQKPPLVFPAPGGAKRQRWGWAPLGCNFKRHLQKDPWRNFLGKKNGRLVVPGLIDSTFITGWWFDKHFFNFHPYFLGKWSNFTTIFQLGGWNQLIKLYYETRGWTWRFLTWTHWEPRSQQPWHLRQRRRSGREKLGKLER